MRTENTRIATLVAAAGLSMGTAFGQDQIIKPEPAKPVVELAILLDTSNSMDGLINQAKTRLWDIVNELALAEQDGQRPSLRVALYEYGNSSLSESDGYVRKVITLTDDLDAVSQELFALTTNGGDEYCGWVIQDATKELDWSNSPTNLRMIVIAGNEPFSQGSVNFHESVPGAIAEGIIVNTIFCGPYQEGINTGWAEGAQLADGQYSHIDQDAAVVHIPSPQDDELLRLNTDLNGTYLGYGQLGEELTMRQMEQDDAAADMSAGVALRRAAAKSSALYTNSKWDLVDAVNEGEADLDEMKEEDLPEEMQKMTPEEREAHIGKLTQDRKTIQERIQQLSAERQTFVDAKRKEMADSGEDTLDKAIIDAIRKAAAKRGFTFQK